jgi:hypothetical protein
MVVGTKSKFWKKLSNCNLIKYIFVFIYFALLAHLNGMMLAKALKRVFNIKQRMMESFGKDLNIDIDSI